MTMEGEKFEIPKDPSQTLPGRSLMSPMLWNLFLKLSRIPEKNDFSRRSWPTSADLGLDAP